MRNFSPLVVRLKISHINKIGIAIAVFYAVNIAIVCFGVEKDLWARVHYYGFASVLGWFEPIHGDPAFPPFGYPWQKGFAPLVHTQNQNQQQNQLLIQEIKRISHGWIHNKDPTVLQKFLVYAIFNGKLYQLKDQHSVADHARHRGSLVEGMIKHGLALARRHMHRNVRLQQHFFQKENDPSQAIPFLLLWGDSCNCMNQGAPKLSFCRLPDMTKEPCHLFTIPSYSMWRTHRKRFSRQELDASYPNYFVHKYPWSSKIPKAIWRGSSTGSSIFKKQQHWTRLPRVQLVQIGHNHSDILDCGFTKIFHLSPEDQETATKELGIVNYMRMQEFMRYRAIIDIDGNAWSARFPNLLCFNSVVIKIEPLFVDGATVELTPWVHYVPATLDNLVETTRYVMAPENEAQMKSIVAAANDWCRLKSTTHDIAIDALWQLVSYAEHLQFANQNSSSWRKEWGTFFKSSLVNGSFAAV